MLCKQCGFNLSERANFCPSCGQKVAEEDRQKNMNQKSPAKFLKILLGCLFTFAVVTIVLMLISEDMTDTVAKQLDSIKEQRLTEAYNNYTSQSFQNATSLENFNVFLNTYPAFSHAESIRFINRNRENDKGTLDAMLMQEHGPEIPVQYKLVKENAKWLIESIIFEDINQPVASSKIAEGDAEIFDSKPLEASIQGLMEQIRKHNLTQAYGEYTSKEFQKETSFKEFKEFVNDNPSISENRSVELNKLTFDNNIATMSGILKVENKLYPVEYELVQEDNTWKIFHFQILTADQSSKESSSLKYVKFVLGNHLGTDSLVSSPERVFKTHSGDIYLNLYVSGAKAGTKIQVTFEHVDTHSTISPVSTRISEDGDAILTFIFSPTVSGWPQGNYRLLATSSSGETGSYEFKVEE